MNFCSNCGCQQNQENKFCSRCGEKIEIIKTTNVIDKGIETFSNGIKIVNNEISQSEYIKNAKEITKNLVIIICEKTVMVLGYIGLFVTTIELVNHFFLGNKLQIIQHYEKYGLNDFWSVFLPLNLFLILSFVFMFLSGLKRNRLLYVTLVYFFLFVGAFLVNNKKNQTSDNVYSTEIETQEVVDTVKNFNSGSTEIKSNEEVKEFNYSYYLTDEVINRIVNDVLPKINNYKIKSVFEQWIRLKIKNEEFGVREVFNLYWNNEDKYNHEYNGPGDVFSSDDVSFGFADINSDGMEDCYVSIAFWAAGSASTIWNEHTFFISNGENYVIDEDFYGKITERISKAKENKKILYFSYIDIGEMDNSGMILKCSGYDEDDARCCPSIERNYSYDFRTKELKLLN